MEGWDGEGDPMVLEIYFFWQLSGMWENLSNHHHLRHIASAFSQRVCSRLCSACYQRQSRIRNKNIKTHGGCKENRRDAMIGSRAAITQLSEASSQLLH